MKRIAAVFIVLLLVLIPYGRVLGWNDDGVDRGPEPMADGTPWSDSLDDLSNVYTQSGGVVGIEISGGDAHLMAGHDEGRITSVAITCPVGYRYDLVLLEADLPGNSYVNISILDPSTPSTLEGFVNEPVPGFINMTGTDESVFRIGTTKYPKIQIQVNLIADGTDRPSLLAWSLYFIPLGEWKDDFLGTGKMTAHTDVQITGNAIELDLTGEGSGSEYDPYPPILFPDSRGDVDVFYPTVSNNDYQNGATIASTTSVEGLATGDLDDDGYLDIVMAGGGANVNSMILWGSSSGTWSTSDKTDLAHQDNGLDAAVGDFDGDGMLDIVIAAAGGMVHDGSYIYLNNGDGTFDKDWDIKITNAGASSYVAAGDLNGDGYDDIVFVKSLVMSAICYFGGVGGPGSIVNISFLQNIPMTARGDLRIEDIDGDGHLDVLFATVDNKEAPIYLGSSTGPDITVDYKLKLKGLPTEVDVGDINADGYLDIAYCTLDSTGSNALVEIFKGTSSGWSTSDKHDIVTQSTTLNAMEVIDIDVDGYEDIVLGDTTTFYVYKGGSTWPTVSSISKAGLGAPFDVAVAASTGGGGGMYRGSFITDPIPLPDGMKWDILHLDGDVPVNTSISVSVLDSAMDPILGYQELTDMSIDLSNVGAWREISVQVDLWSANNTTAPVLDSLLVNWLDRMAWRDQFYGTLKSESMLGLDVVDLRLTDKDASGAIPDDLVFASLRDDGGFNTKSIAFLQKVYDPFGTTDYSNLSPLTFRTQGASAVSSYLVNDDYLPDFVFSSYGTADGSYSGSSPLFLGSAAGWYGTPYHSFSTTGASDVLLTDLNGDGFADVVFAQERNAQGPNVASTLFWGSTTGWNSTPDMEFATTGASGVDVADFNNDAKPDLVFSCYEGVSLETDSMVFLQDVNGYCATSPSHRLPTVGARAVGIGDLDKDGWSDVVFANSFDGDSYDVDSYIYWNNDGAGFVASPTELPTMGAVDVLVRDLTTNTYPDITFANNRNATAGYMTESYVYRNTGPGTFTTFPSYSLPTDGAYAVTSIQHSGSASELVFACRNNGTTYRIPSLLFRYHTHVGWTTPDIELPTVGAVDVITEVLNKPFIGGYLSRPITPDPNDDIGAFHTLKYEAGLGSHTTGSIRLVDAATMEVLAEHQLIAGTQEWDLRSALSFRDHPSIRILIEVDEVRSESDFFLDDLWLNWTKRVMEAPVVVDLGLEETSVQRTDTVRLWVNVTDEYDYPEDLTVLIEHQLDGETTWKTSMLGSLSFGDGLWWRDVAPDRYQPLGIYSFRVNITDSDREASGYKEFPSTLEVLPNLLGAPRLLTATPGAGSVELEWRSPLDTGDLPVDGYRVLRGNSEDDLSVIDSVDQFTEGYSDTGLVNGVAYYYAILAYNDLGDGPWSDILNATPVDAPGIPLNLIVEAGDGTVSLTWYPPLFDGGIPILGYHILRGGTPDSLIEIADIGSEGEFTDEALTNGVTYYYAVLAYNNIGAGPRTEPVEVTPLGLPASPDGLTSEVSTQGITLRWQAPGETGGGDIIGFVIYRGLADDALEALESVSGSTTQFLDDDVTAGTTYYYAIAAETAAGEGARSVALEVAALGQPGVPKDLTADAGDGKVTLSWLAPDSDGGSPVTGYVVLRGASTSNLEDLAELSTVLSYVDTSAVNGETYHYAVIAVNALGRGLATDTIEATPFMPTSVPGKVAAFTAEIKGTRAVLAWAIPNDDGGSPITGYVILRGETRNTMVEIDQVGVVLSYIDEGLDRGMTYYFSVRAVNDEGQSDAFDPQSVKIEEESDSSGFPIAILIALVIIVVVVLAALFMRPGRKDEGEYEAPQEDLQEGREEVPEETDEGVMEEEGTDEEESRPEIVIEHIEVR